MTDGAAIPNPDLVQRFAALVALAVERPTEAREQRDAAKGVIGAAKAGAVTFALVDGALQADGVPVEAPVLVERLRAHGIDALGITPRASQADLYDLVRLLASAPGADDPAARFAARAAAIDPRALPRTLRQRTATPAMTPAVEAAPAAPAAPVTETTIPAVAPARRTPRANPRVSADLPPAEPRDAPVRLIVPLAIPAAANPVLASVIRALEQADEPRRLIGALEQLVLHCDLAFRQGRHDDLIEGVAALVAIEFRQLERDASDEQRQAFNHSVRRLARPVLLRQLAVLRHQRARDPVATERLQQVLYRFGADGAEAVLDECICCDSPEALAVSLECLRGLPRRHEALATLLADPNDVVVRQAVAILGAMQDAPSEAALDGLLDHVDARTRRDAVAAVARFAGENAFASLALALGDESSMVRVRAVNGLAARRDPRLLPLLEPVLKAEAEREVLYAAVDALGRLGTPESVQALIAIAQGQGANPLRDTSGVRIQACLALVTIRTPQAMAAVQLLRDDRDREVRQASMRLVAHARRRTTTQQSAVIAP
jgi:HEAT repeats